jgi:hypothetical protein
MSKRRRFKGTTKQHRTRAGSALRDFKAAAKYTDHLLRSGTCRGALDALQATIVAATYFHDNRYWGRANRKRATGGIHRETVFNRMSKLKQRYFEACTRG